MTLIEGIGDEVTHFFIGLLVVLVVTLAWWTTSISEHRHVQTVWLLDRRRHRTHRRLTNHTHTVTIAEGTTSPVNSSSDSGEAVTVPAEIISKPPEAGTSGTENDIIDEEGNEEEEQSRIVETMDSEACVLRQRRLAFYSRNGTSGTRDPPAEPSLETPIESIATAYNSDPTIMEHNYAEKTPDNTERAVLEEQEPRTPTVRDTSEIRIKLKYINDDLKLVDGKLQEQLGDFKKRHFQGEITSNKLVRLIFNGQVLHQDTKTLQGCGFFDNCVVHCLIHQRRSGPEDESGEIRGENGSLGRNRNGAPNNNNNQRDWDLGNFLFALITFTLLSAWYFRYVYAHLYTITATVGLILITAVFSIVLFGFYFPDQEHVPQRMENPSAQL